MADKAHTHSFNPYEMFILILCLFALISLAFETFIDLTEESRLILEYSDFAVCLVFLGDFFHSLYKAKKKMNYFLTWGWIDLLSSVPSINVLRWGRAARVLRILRLLRGAKATKIIGSFILGKRNQSALLAIVLLSFLILTFSSIAILQMEKAPGANIKSAGDAVWWAVITLLIGGNGEVFPVTTEGKIISVCLMVCGLALVGVITGYAASWFLAPSQEKEESDIAMLKKEIEEIKEMMKEGKG